MLYSQSFPPILPWKQQDHKCAHTVFQKISCDSMWYEAGKENRRYPQWENGGCKTHIKLKFARCTGKFKQEWTEYSKKKYSWFSLT